MSIRFPCPICEHPAHVAAPARWQCPACDHALEVQPEIACGRVITCGVCGNRELYKKKDFPHWLGLTILGVACLAFVMLQGYYHQWLGWAIFIGSAAFDGLLYLMVGDVVVCYRCGAHHRGLPTGSGHPPFELGVAERYRQERIRRLRLEAEKK